MDKVINQRHIGSQLQSQDQEAFRVLAKPLTEKWEFLPTFTLRASVSSRTKGIKGE